MGRRVGALVVAVVVAAALLVAGVLVAGGGRSPSVLPALELEATGTASADQGAADAAAEPALASRGGAEPARPYDAGDRPRPWPPVTYKLKGPLPTLPDRARAWKVSDDPGPGRVAAVAAALGLRGRPKEGASGWTVTDGSRVLTVNRLAGAPWSYGTGVLGGCVGRAGGGPYRPGGGLECLDPDTPVSNKPVRPVPPVSLKPVAPARPFRPVNLPSRQEAERIARDLAAAAGLDLAGATVRVADAYAARLVTITPAVGGLPTAGFAWTVRVGAKGRIQHAGGYLAVPQEAGSYPLIGVDEGFERLKRTPPIGPLRYADAPAIERDPCPTGAKLPCPKPLPARVATVTGVRLGLQLAPAVAKGSRPADLAYLLPAYLFELEGGWTDVRPIVAVQDRYLTRP